MRPRAWLLLAVGVLSQKGVPFEAKNVVSGFDRGRLQRLLGL